MHCSHYCCSLAKSCPTLCNPMDCSTPGFPVLGYLPAFVQIHCPLSQWCHPTISSSVAPFSFCPQSFPASGSFPMSWLFTLGGPKYWIFSFSISPSNEYSGLISLGLTGLISLQSRGFSGVFSSTTNRKHQFSGAQLSVWTNSHICLRLLENHSFDYMDLFQQSDVSDF